MADHKRPPEYYEQKKKELLQKIEPYLRIGLSVRKALLEAKLNNAEFYKFMSEDESFREEINRYRQFVAVMLNNALVSHLQTIIKKQTTPDPKTKKLVPLPQSDIEFLKWVALNNNFAKDEWGERKTYEVYDPEAEIQRVKALIDENAGEEIDHGTNLPN